MNRKDYISDGLIHIRDRLKTYEKGNDHDASTLPRLSEAESASVDAGAAPKPAPDKKLIRALHKRRQEYLKSKKDLQNKLAEAVTALAEDQKKYKLQEEETAKLHELFRNIAEDIGSMSEKDDLCADDSALLADACRKIENHRLEFIRQNIRYQKIMPHESHSGGQKSSLLPELNSMTFWQLLRLGGAFTLPLAAAFLLAAALISAVIYLTMFSGGA